MRNKKDAEMVEKDALRRVVLAFVVFQLILHIGCLLWQRDPRMVTPHLVAWLHDSVLLFAVWGLFILLRRFLPQKADKVLNIAALACSFGLAFLLAVYPAVLREFLAFPHNIFAVTGGTVGIFLKDYLGFWGLCPGLAAVAVGVAVLRWRKKIPIPRWLHLWVLVPPGICAVVTLPRSPNPIVFSIHEEIKEWLSGPREVERLRAPREFGWSPRNHLALTDVPPSKPLTADCVILVVLETVSATEFEQWFLKESSFYNRVHQHAAYFLNYYTTNLDSYPALIAMLVGVQVPFRAYADVGLYEAANQADNLTRQFRRRGYATLFVCPYEHQPFVPTRAEWDRIILGSELGQLEGYARVGGSRMESAVEDRAALPAILKFIRSHKKTFILHEMVYGHSPAWKAHTGLDTLSYCDRYLCELYDGLAKAGILERALIVVVADHGDRFRDADPNSYRVPLLVAGRPVSPATHKRLLCHLDLAAILTHYLAATPLPPPRRSILTVGSTARWVYGQITSKGEYMFVYEGRGKVLARRGSLEPSDLRHRFQKLINDFCASYTR